MSVLLNLVYFVRQSKLNLKQFAISTYSSFVSHILCYTSYTGITWYFVEDLVDSLHGLVRGPHVVLHLGAAGPSLYTLHLRPVFKRSTKMCCSGMNGARLMPFFENRTGKIWIMIWLTGPWIRCVFSRDPVLKLFSILTFRILGKKKWVQKVF